MVDEKISPKFILVSGGMAVGKTSIARRLTQYIPNAQLFEEDIDKNPYLTKFYKDMKAWSFHSRIAFLEMRTRIYRELLEDAKYILIDRSLHELIVFAKAHLSLINKSYEEWLAEFDSSIIIRINTDSFDVYTDSSVKQLAGKILHKI